MFCERSENSTETDPASIQQKPVLAADPSLLRMDNEIERIK